MLIAANFHYVRAEYPYLYPGIHGLTPAEFGAQLDALAKAGTFVGPRDIETALNEGLALPERALLITFDDGLREQYEIAWPILRQKGIPAMFYANSINFVGPNVSTVHKIHLLRATLPPAQVEASLDRAATAAGVALGDSAAHAQEAASQYPYDTPEAARLKYLLNFKLGHGVLQKLIDAVFADLYPESETAVHRQLYMTNGQLSELARDGMVGSHGHEHVPLGQLTEAEADWQIEEGVGRLRQVTGGATIASFSFPYGSKTACSRVLAMAGPRVGVRFGFTMERAGNRDLRHPLFLGRFASNDLPGGNHCRFDAATLFESVADARWFRDFQ